MFELTDKVAIITGSTRGIGRAIAEAFIAAGAKVVVSGTSAEGTRKAATELDTLGIACDVSDEGALAALLEGTVAHFGGLDILVCCAGISGQTGTSTLEDFDSVMHINLRSQIALTNLAMPHIAKRRGNVVLVSSISGLRGNIKVNAYAYAKAGVMQLARNLADQWGPMGVRVNAIAPGLIRTEMTEGLQKRAEFMERRMQLTPQRRMGEPEEVAGAAVFLASPAGGFVNGHVLVVDGGTVISDGLL